MIVARRSKDRYASAVLRRLQSLMSHDHCPVLPWWATSGQDALGVRLRRLAGRGFRINRSFFRLKGWLLLFTWPLRSLLQILRLNSKHWENAQQRSGKGRWRQLLAAILVAARHFLPARHFYVYEIFDVRQRDFGLKCLNESEMMGLFAWLNRGTSSPVIHDKRRFGEWCREHSLPAPPTITCIERGSPDYPSHSDATEFFIKPVRGFKGVGCALWKMTEENVFTDATGRSLPREDLVKHLRHESRSLPLLVQSILQNHPQISDLSTGPLAAVRLVTGRYPDERIVIVAATFKMPKGNAFTNNLGISSRVDQETGRLGPAHAYSPFRGPFERHPDTDSEIVGRQLPDWEQVKSLGLKAHGLIADYVFLGWDIALTAAGPVLLEGNANWDTLSIQKSHQAPLTELPFGEICEQWLPESDDE